MIDNPRSFVIFGATASGKSALAMELANDHQGEIVSFDSVQIYRGFDIGSAKPTKLEMKQVRHHMIDIKDWHDDYDARMYACDAKDVIADIHARGKKPIIVGGTGLYLRALWGDSFHQDLPKDEELRRSFEPLENVEIKARLHQLDPVRGSEIHVNDRFRLIRALELVTLLGKPLSSLHKAPEEKRDGAYVIYLRPDRKQLHRRIESRTDQMLELGFIEEVEALLASGVDPACKPMQSIGYKQVSDYLRGLVSKNELGDRIKAATRQYAKRQETWFNKVPSDLIREV